MAQTKDVTHTEGKWSQHPTFPDRIISQKGDRIASTATPHRTFKEDVANAVLIAAAPDLLAVCETLLSDDFTIQAARQMAQEAIAKAKGGAA